MIVRLLNRLFGGNPDAPAHAPLRASWGGSLYCQHGYVANRCPKATVR